MGKRGTITDRDRAKNATRSSNWPSKQPAQTHRPKKPGKSTASAAWTPPFPLQEGNF